MSFCLLGLMIQSKLWPATQLWSTVCFCMAHELRTVFTFLFLLW